MRRLRPLRRIGATLGLAAFLLGVCPGRAWAAGDDGSRTSPLPMLRWADAVGSLHTHALVGEATGGGLDLTGVASLFFELSSFIWQVLASLVTAAQGASSTNSAMSWVNPVYRRLGSALLSAGTGSLVVVVVIVGAGLAAYRAAGRGLGVGGALRGVAGVLLPVAALVVTVHDAAGPADRGSPGWAVAEVGGWTSSLAGSVAALAGSVTPPTPDPLSSTGGPPQADCTGLLAGLDALHSREAAPGSGGPAALQDGDEVALSRLWESAVMVPWERAQFGTGALGQKAFCHLLEIQAGVPAADQLAALAADTPATSGSGPVWSQLAAPGASQAASILGPSFAGGDDDLMRTMVAWAACDYVGPTTPGNVGGWVVDPAFAPVTTGPTASSCNQWWTSGTTQPAPQGSNDPDGPFDFEDNATIITDTASAPAARAYIQSLDGTDGSGALSDSGVALVASAATGWALGGLAGGVLLGKLCLVLLVGSLPLLLLLAAIPTTTTRRMAARAGVLLVASGASTFVFSALLGLLLLFIGLLQQASADLLPATGTLPGLSEALVPLAALHLLRRLLRLGGVDGITTYRGALRTSLAVGRHAVGAGTAGAAIRVGPAGPGFGLDRASITGLRRPEAPPRAAGAPRSPAPLLDGTQRALGGSGPAPDREPRAGPNPVLGWRRGADPPPRPETTPTRSSPAERRLEPGPGRLALPAPAPGPAQPTPAAGPLDAPRPGERP